MAAMRCDLFRSLWGWPIGPESDWAACGRDTRDAGFVGVEARLPPTVEGAHALRRALEGEGLDYIAVVFTGGDVIPDQAWSPDDHLAFLERAIERAQVAGARFVNALPGNDRWPLAQQVDFLSRAHDLGTRAGIMVSLETHRASSLYSPWLTLEIIAQAPDLRFTADLSHWLVVAERCLDDPADDWSPFLDRVHHAQARVGYDQGPQVPHPAAPEYARWLEWHRMMWEQVWAQHRAAGRAWTSVTPEFGPDGYTHLLPFTRAPIADVWDLNRWMAADLRRQFDQWSRL